jgi:hypothetical protein
LIFFLFFKEFSMKNVFKMKAIRMMAGIIALAAVIGLSFAACDNGTTSGGGSSTPNTSLNGVWDDGGGERISISGSTGTITRLRSSYGSLWQSAVDKGYFKIGTQYFRSLSKTDDLKWTGEMMLVTYRTSAPNVAVGTSYTKCYITMDSNGQSFTASAADSGGAATLTFYRY